MARRPSGRAAPFLATTRFSSITAKVILPVMLAFALGSALFVAYSSPTLSAETTPLIDGQFTAATNMMGHLTKMFVLISLGIGTVIGLSLFFVVHQPIQALSEHLFLLSQDADLSRRLRWKKGDELGRVAHHVDELVAALEEKDTLNASLKRRFNERAEVAEQQAAQLKQLALALTKAEQRERERLAEILHDHLQQQLAAAKLNVGRIARRPANDEQRAIAKQAADMLDEAIQISRSLSVELNPPVLQQTGLVGGLQWLAKDMGRAHDLEITVDLDENANPIDDHVCTLLFRAAREFLFNVSKHAGTREATLMLALRDEEIVLEVSDRGGGVQGEVNAKKDRYGLAHLRSRLELLGGSLELVFPPEGGARATVCLRATIDPPPPPTPTPGSLALPLPPTRAIRVLLVDDLPIFRTALARLLESAEDMEIVGTAADGATAIAETIRLLPDVVIMDESMPGMKGSDATREIRTLLPSTRVIGLSMHEIELLDEMTRAGAERVLNKRASPEELLDAIRTPATSA